MRLAGPPALCYGGLVGRFASHRVATVGVGLCIFGTPAPVLGAPGEDRAAPSDPAWVHMEIRGSSDAPVVLRRIMASERGAPLASVSECEAPCNRVVNRREGSDFFVDGPGTPRSAAFSLRGQGDELTLRVRPGRWGVLRSGWVLTAVGSAAILAGFATVALAPDGRKIGGIVAGAGAPIAAAGVVMIAFGRTRVELVTVRRRSAHAARGGRDGQGAASRIRYRQPGSRPYRRQSRRQDPGPRPALPPSPLTRPRG